jgi:hypothetical protein
LAGGGDGEGDDERDQASAATEVQNGGHVAIIIDATPGEQARGSAGITKLFAYRELFARIGAILAAPRVGQTQGGRRVVDRRGPGRSLTLQ